MSQPQKHFWTAEHIQKRRVRARALAFILAFFAILIFLITIVKLGGNVALRQL